MIRCFLLLFTLLSSSFGADDPLPPQPWPEAIRRKVRNLVDHTAVQLSSALFNSANEFKITLLDFPNKKGDLGLKLHRDVLDNFDLLNTYTVIDRVQLKVTTHPFPNLSTWTEDHATSGIGTPYAGVVFEPQTSIDWVNVRSVSAFNYVREKTPSPGSTDPKSLAPLPGPTPDPDLSELNPDIPLAFFDPSLRPRFSKIPNLLTFPFRLPLHRQDVSRMKDGEILGYAFDGQIEVGIAAGLKIIPTLDVLHAGIEARGTVITHGRYQISVLRENARYARVKLTRLKERGIKGGLKIGVDRYQLYDGMMIFKGKKTEQDGLLKTDLKLIPFAWETSTFRADQFDVIYRYDLDTEEGKRAFHKAVLGKFALSDEIAEQRSKDPGDKSVEHLLSRDGVRRTNAIDFKIDSSGILKLNWNRKAESLEATLELPDGTHHLFQGQRETRKQRDSLFKTTRESRVRRMTLVFDQELFDKHDHEAIYLIAEITEEDSSTNGRELNRSILRMEKFLRKPDILPTLATRIPRLSTDAEHPKNGRRAWFGRSSFYYGYSLSWTEISAFLQSERGRVKEKAIQHLNSSDANDFISAWDWAVKAFTENQDHAHLFRALKKLFIGRFPIEALTNVLFDVLQEHPIDTFMTAQNISFGRIQERGKTITTVENLLTFTDRELGFESYAQRVSRDDDAVVTQLRVAPRRDGILRLTFSLSHTPENVFFRLFRTTGAKRQKRVAEIMVNNRSKRFKAGENTIDLDPYSLDLLTSKLARELRSDQFYSLSMAHARGASRFGPVTTVRFDVNPPYPDP